jgi:hypothetical protein
LLRFGEQRRFELMDSRRQIFFRARIKLNCSARTEPREQRPRRKIAWVLLAVLLLCASVHAADKIRIGFPDLAAPFVPLAIGDKRGFFQEEGLQGEFIRINRR